MGHYAIYPETNVHITHHFVHYLDHDFEWKVMFYLIYISYGAVMILTTGKFVLTLNFVFEQALAASFQLLPLIQNELMVVGNKSPYITADCLRTLPNICFEIRALGIWFRALMNLAGFMLSPWSFLLSNTAVYANIMLITKWKELAGMVKLVLFVASISGQLSWILALHVASFLHNFSKRVLLSLLKKNWGRRRDNFFIRKWRNGSRALRFANGNAYVVKRKSVLMFIKNIYRRTFKALVALKRS